MNTRPTNRRNGRKFITTGATLFVAAALTACANSGGYGSSESSSYGYGKSKAAEQEETTAVEANKTVTVNISNFAFQPAFGALKSGQRVPAQP
ncbi:MAG: hypothetical protein AAF404_14320 [Pseudomonadota bacterium]